MIRILVSTRDFARESVVQLVAVSYSAWGFLVASWYNAQHVKSETRPRRRSLVVGALARLAPLERVNVKLLDARISADNFFAMNIDLVTS